MTPRKITELLAKREAGIVKMLTTNVLPGEGLAQVLSNLGIHCQAAAGRQLDAGEARELLCGVLAKDMAYGVEVMPREMAAELVDRIMFEVFPSGARLLTNLEGEVWATTATFSAGVLAIGRESAVCLWVEDED